MPGVTRGALSGALTGPRPLPPPAAQKDLFTAKVNESGSASVTFAWSPRGDLLAAAGTQPKVTIYNRKGQVESVFEVSGDGKGGSGPAMAALVWDGAGDRLVRRRGGAARSPGSPPSGRPPPRPPPASVPRSAPCSRAGRAWPSGRGQGWTSTSSRSRT